MSNVVYICDGKACSSKELPSCKLDCPSIDVCHHTRNLAHAKYGICKDPENHPEQFEQIENGDFWDIEKDMSHG